MQLPAPTQADIQQIVDLVVAEVAPLRIMLLGSAARGELREGSDVDLMVIVPNGHRCLDVTKNLYRLMARHHIHVDVDFHVTTLEAYDRYRDTVGRIHRQVEREGLELHAA